MITGWRDEPLTGFFIGSMMEEKSATAKRIRIIKIGQNFFLLEVDLELTPSDMIPLSGGERHDDYRSQ